MSQQIRVGDEIFERQSRTLATRQNEVLVERIRVVRYAQDRTHRIDLQHRTREITQEAALFRQCGVIVVAVGFQIIAVIGEGAVQRMPRPERIGAVNLVDVTVPDVNLVAAGHGRAAAPHHLDRMPDLIRRIEVVIVHADDVIAARQPVQLVSLLPDAHALDFVIVANRRPIGLGRRELVDQIAVAFRRIVEDYELAPIGRIILIPVHVEQIRQERAAIPGRTDDAHERRRFARIGARSRQQLRRQAGQFVRPLCIGLPAHDGSSNELHFSTRRRRADTIPALLPGGDARACYEPI